MKNKEIEDFEMFILSNHKLGNHDFSESLWHISLANHGVEYAEEKTFYNYSDAKKVFDYLVSNPIRNGKFESITEMPKINNPKTVAIWQTIENYKSMIDLLNC